MSFDASAAFDFRLRTRLVFGAGTLDRLGELAAELEFPAHAARRRSRPRGDRLRRARGRSPAGGGHRELSLPRLRREPRHGDGPEGRRARRASTASTRSWRSAAAARSTARRRPTSCSRAAASCRTTGATERPRQPLRPMIGIPTTAGTGSEAQSYALVSDAGTHVKMACGDPTAAFRVAILDPLLTASQPAGGRGRGRLRRAFARGRVVRLHPPQSPVGGVLARGLAAARAALRARGEGSSRRVRARRHAPGRALRRRGHRGVHARRRPRVREPAHRPLRDGARRRDRADAAGRLPVERAGRGRRDTRSCCGSRERRPVPNRRKRWRHGFRTSRRKRACHSDSERCRCRKRIWRDSRRKQPSNGPDDSIRGRSTRQGALELYRAAW